MPNQFRTLTSFTYPTESYILVAKLEGEGIKCFLKNEKLVQTDNFLSNAVGGVEVQVREEDFAKASAILKKVEAEKKQGEAVPAEFGKDFEKVLVYCPECESTNVYRKKGGLFSFGAKEHVCGECWHRWKE